MLDQCVTALYPTAVVDDQLDLLAPIGPPETQKPRPAATGAGLQSIDIRGDVGGEYNAEIVDLLAPQSPLDRVITVSTFTTVTDVHPTAHRMTLRQVAEMVTKPRSTLPVNASESERDTAKKRLPLLKLGAYQGTRSKDAFVSIEGVEGDYDAGLVSVDLAIERLRAARLAAVVYTTPSHTTQAPRWRVLCPTSKTLSAEDGRGLCERVNGALHGILGPESFDGGRAYFYGGLGGDPCPVAFVIEGRAIDLAWDVPRIAKGDRALGASPAPEVVDLLADDDDYLACFRTDWAEIDAALPFIPADERDVWLRVGMALHNETGGSDKGFERWAAWSQASEKYDDRDQRRTWQSFGGRRRGEPVRLATLFDLAKSHGWKVKTATVVTSSRLTFLSPGECEATPSRGYVVKGILAPGDVGCIFGAPGAGKSLISPHLGYAVAQGRAAFGMRTKPGRVFYVAAEDPHGMRGRVTALKMRHGDAEGFTLVEGVSDLLAEDSPDLAALTEAVEAQRPALIFLDTLAMAFPGLEENSAEAMGRVVAVARSLTKWGAAVVLIHHDTKAEGKTPRGHSLLNGALDMAMHVSRDEFGVVRGKLTKNRNGSCDRDMAFLIDTRTLGQDEDGDPITAALVDELDCGLSPKVEKLSPSARVAFDILVGLEADNPDNVDKGVAEVDWRDACVAGRALSGSEDLESRKRAFRRASKELAGQGRTIVIGDRVRSHNPLPFNGFDDLSDGLDD